MLVLGTADVLGTDDLLGTADVERCSRQSAHRLQLESSVYSGPKSGQMARWQPGRALPTPNTDTPPARFGRPPLSGALSATAWLWPVSGGGGVAARHPTWSTSRSRSGKEVVNARRSRNVPLGPYLRPSERHPPEEAPEIQ